MPGGWVPWAVVLTSVGVFIILNLLRNRDETRRGQPNRREVESNDDDDAPSGEQQQRRQQPVTDFDRYLQDFQRRRQVKERGPQRPRPQPVVRQAQPIDRRPRRQAPMPAPTPAARSTVDAPLAHRPAPARNDPIPFAIPVDAPAPKAVSAALPVPPPMVFPSALPASARAHVTGQARSLRDQARSDSFVSLLQSKQSLRNIIILREILDPPLSKRRRSL